MSSTKKLLLFAAVFCFTTVVSFAQDKNPKITPVKFLLRGGLELGGDNIADVYFTNGEKQSVKAGQGGTLAIGGQLQFPGLEKLLLQATVGYKYLTTQADNVHIRLTRVPINLTAHWMVANKFRIGGGLAMHSNIKFRTDGLGQDMDFDGASGPTFEVAYSGIGLSYTAMTYKDKAKNVYSANAIGLTFSLTIPNQ